MRLMAKVCAVVAVLMFTGIATAQKDAGGKGAGRGQMLEGQVVKVEEGKVTVKAGKGDKGQETVVATSDKTEVVVNGLSGKLADLKAGQVARIARSSDVATKIEADDNLVNGQVVKVEDGKVTVQAGGQKGSPVVVTTTDKTTVMINGAAGKVADLKAGQTARISQADSKATRIEARDASPVANNKGNKGGK